MESDVDVDLDADVVFKDPALYKLFCSPSHSWIFKSLSPATATTLASTTYLLKNHTPRLNYTHLMLKIIEIAIFVKISNIRYKSASLAAY